MNNWINKGDDFIRSEIIQIAKEETGLTNLKKTGVFRAFLETIAKIVNHIYSTIINDIFAQTSLDSAGGFWLSLWGLMLGVSRKKASKTKGTVQIKGFKPGQIKAGTWISVLELGLRYKVTEDCNFTTEFVTVPVVAEFEGSKYNIAEGFVLHSPKVISGLEKIEMLQDWIDTLGEDEEQDDHYRERIKNKWRMQGEGAPKSRYEYIASSVVGVSQVKVIRAPRGYGSTDIIIASVEGMPSTKLLNDVRSALESHALICRDLRVKAPLEHPVDFSIEFKGGSISIDQIKAELKIAISKIGISKPLQLKDLYQHFAKFNFDWFQINQPLANIEVSGYSIIIPNSMEVVEK